MKILNVLFSKGWGGLERYAVEKARAMAERGHDVCFLRRAGSDTARALAAVNFPGAEWNPVKYIDLRVMAAVRSLVRREGYRVVHCHHSADLGLVAPALWRVPEARLVFSSYMNIPEPKKDFYHRLEYGRVDCVTVLADGLIENARANLPVAPERVVTMPYGLDMSRFDPDNAPKGALRATLEAASEKSLIGILGRLDPHKGQMTLIEAMPDIIGDYPETALVFIGEETPELRGKYRAELEAKVARLGLDDKVMFTGAREDVAAVLADLDVYVMASRAETFGMSTMEAMAMGRAIVGAKSGGTPNLLDGGECGLLAEPNSPASFAQKIKTLLGDPAMRTELGRKARAKVLRHHDRNTAMDRLEAIYRGEV